MIKKLVPFFLLASLAGYAQKPSTPQKPGMVSYTYRHSFAKDVGATLDTIRAFGITDMEFSNLFNRKAEDIKQLLDERQMQCSSFGVSYDDFLNKTDEVARNAKALGAKYVRVAWIPHNGPFTLAMADETVANFNRVGKVLKENHGLTFCYHNHGFEFEPYQNGTLFDYIVQKTDPAYVSFEMDILWTFFPGHDPAALLQKYGKRFKLMHLKDLKKGVKGNLSGGTPVENDVALGTGQLNLPEIMKAAKKYSGIRHYYIEDESPNVNKQVPQTIAYLKKL